MNESPRDPLHRPRPNPQQAAPRKDPPSPTPVPEVPKPATPDYGDKPEQTPQVESGAKKA